MAAAPALPRRGSGPGRALVRAATSRPAVAAARSRVAGVAVTAGLLEPATRPRPALRAVPTRAPAHRGVRILLLLAAAVILTLGVLGTVALNALAAEASFEARALERDIADLTLRRDDLIAAVASLEAPNRVREVATGQLGLMEPESPGFLEVDPADMPPADPKPLVRLGR